MALGKPFSKSSFTQILGQTYMANLGSDLSIYFQSESLILLKTSSPNNEEEITKETSTSGSKSTIEIHTFGTIKIRYTSKNQGLQVFLELK
jgi:hypothetical protein